jgi:hypothetical protein
MSTGAPPAKDDRLTLIATSVLACVLQDILHEGLGHAVTAWLSGAHHVTISTVAMQSDIDTRWISASGTLVNLAFAGVFWLLLRNRTRYGPALRYFLVLAMTGNLFTGTGYFFFSGIANFGDWAAVIHDLQPYWLWRAGLITVGAASYYVSMLLVAAELRPFQVPEESGRRIRNLSWTPYFTDGILAGVAGVLNPAGLFYVIASALPSTLGANAGLLTLPSIMRGQKIQSAETVAPIPRSLPWIAIGAVVALLFIVVLGRGISWSR